MTPLPGTPPLSEWEGWLARVAELLERIAALEAERDALDARYKAEVLDYERRLAELLNEASAIEAERDATLTVIAEVRAALYGGHNSADDLRSDILAVIASDHLAGAGKKVPR